MKQCDAILCDFLFQNVDASKRNETWDDRGKVDLNLSIPLLMQNKIPEGFETDDKLDVSLRAEEVISIIHNNYIQLKLSV